MKHGSLTEIRSSNHLLDLMAASRDLWPGGTLEFWQGVEIPRPNRVFWPEDEEQVVRILQESGRAGVPVVPYGEGSGVVGGARGTHGSIVLDTKALDRIGPLDEARWTVDAEAGVNGQLLEDWLNARGWTVGHSPSSIWCSSVGGWVAARSAGQFSSRYGVFEDMVLQLRIATPAQGMVTIGEDGDGPPDWMPLMIGSEGTLGVITRVRMRVWPLPERRWLWGYRFPSVSSTVRAMRQLMQEELWPSVVRMYDPVDTQIGGKTKPRSAPREDDSDAFFWEWLKRVDQIRSVRQRTLTLPLALPSVVNEIFSRVSSGCLLVVGWEGDPEVVEVLSNAGKRILDREGEDLGEEPGQRWFHSRHHVSYKLMPVFERGGFADTMEVAGRWSQLESLYQEVRRAIGRTAVVMAHMSHVYPEGGSIYFSFAGRGSLQVYQRTWEAALQACLDVGATVTHHHGVGSLKAAAASAEVGPAVGGWKALKRRLDPHGVLNPGRLFVEVRHRDPGPPPRLAPEDGLVRTSADASLEARAKADPREARWPWERLPGPPRWQRLHWQVGWIEVDGVVDGLNCRLGRGPRSAAGPDLRPWLVERSEIRPHVTSLVADAGPRWMGEALVEAPWKVALDLLRSDLRPASLTVRDGVLRVGFRGEAAAALGRLASQRVPGGLQEVEWDPAPFPSGPLEPCALDDPEAVSVNLSGAFKRVGGDG
ncbi:MAG: FAD-binding oxidoreductase [Deltaproteobacteria bacterium]|nr:FAD-binding oxidoreductase [Deltaproteobacteria bacterium]